jgi:predicted RND superfamily exporter protein
MPAIAGLPWLVKALVPDNAVSVWFVDDDPNLIAYQHFHRDFGNDEVIAMAIHREEGIFRQNNLEKISQLTATLGQIGGVERVFSITNAEDIQYGAGSSGFGTLIPAPIPGDSVLATLREQATGSSLIADRLISKDGKTAMLVIRMSIMQDIDLKRDAIIDRVTAVATQYLGKENVHLGGIGVIFSGLNRITQHDFGLFVSLSYLMMFIIIWVLYRNWRIVLLALGTLLTATLLTLELYGLLGYQVNMITMMLPTLIMLLGVMDNQHILNEFFFAKRQGNTAADIEKHIVTTFQHTLKPCLFTTLTTVAGFMSLALSPMAVLKEFGIFAAIGLLLALCCSYVFSAIALWHIAPVMDRHPSAPKLTPLLEQFMVHIHRHRRLWWSGIIILCIVLAYGWTHVVTDTYTLGYLPSDHKVVKDHEYIQQHWGDYFPVEFTVSTSGSKTVIDTDVVRAMRGFIDEAVALPEVRTALGLNSFYDQVFPATYGPFWESAMVQPTELKRVTLTAMRRDSALMRSFITSDLKTTRITFTGKMMSAGNLSLVIQQVTAIGQRHFKGIARVTATGYPPLYARIIDYIMNSQKSSFWAAFGMIFLLFLMLLRDIKLAFLAVIPNLFPVLLLLGVMGYFGITLDIATATVAAIVIGFSVDDTVHYMHNYQIEKRSYTPYRAQRRVMRHVGSAIVLTSIVIFVGFLILLFASVKTVFYFGLLTAISIAGELTAQLILLPLMLSAFDGKVRRPNTA